MGGFLGKKCCGHFSITKHQYPKKQLQWIVWGDGSLQAPLSIKVKWSKSMHMILLKKAILGY